MCVKSYTVDLHSIFHARIVEALTKPDFKPDKEEKKWYVLIRRLPTNLQEALLSELRLGNCVSSIQYSNQPQSESIFVCLSYLFKSDFSSGSFGFKYRELNDPHYWNKEIGQAIDGVDYLIIC